MELSSGRGSRIRTCGPLLPKQVLYQAELCPDARDLCRYQRSRQSLCRGHIPTFVAFLFWFRSQVNPRSTVASRGRPRAAILIGFLLVSTELSSKGSTS